MWVWLAMTIIALAVMAWHHNTRDSSAVAVLGEPDHEAAAVQACRTAMEIELLPVHAPQRWLGDETVVDVGSPAAPEFLVFGAVDTESASGVPMRVEWGCQTRRPDLGEYWYAEITTTVTRLVQRGDSIMGRTRIDVAQVCAELDRVVDAAPQKIDRRPAGRLTPRYIENGAPACLAGRVMHGLGVSVPVLRSLDREAVRLEDSRLAIRRRFVANAWALLAAVQRGNDSGHTWSWVRGWVLTPSLRPRPWLADLDRRKT